MAQTFIKSTSRRGQIGQGIYSLAELRTYLAYFGEPEDGDQALHWLGTALNPVAHEARLPDYSFSDLVSLFVVRELTRLGVKPWRIREAEEHMRRVRRTDRPFVSEDIASDGRTVFFANEEPGQVESANRGGGQQVNRHVIAPYLKRIRYTDGAAVAWSPTKHILLDPLVQFGDPVVEGTRVPTSAISDIAEVSGVEEAAQRLHVPVRAATAAVQFEQKLEALRS
jgi:uncharacterized protein (DUF433 family)